MFHAINEAADGPPKTPVEPRPAVPAVPSSIQRSPLMRRGGFDVFEGIVDAAMRERLLAEAIFQQRVMTDCLVERLDREEIRGGAPRRKFRTSAGGEYQRRFYRAAWLLELLRSLTTPRLAPTGEYGTYSFYTRPGDYLDLHRDILSCDVAVITCLKNRRGAGRGGGSLRLYPTRTGELLSEIRAAPATGAEDVSLDEGQTLVMYGGIVPHALLPVGEQQQRIVSVLCFKA